MSRETRFRLSTKGVEHEQELVSLTHFIGFDHAFIVAYDRFVKLRWVPHAIKKMTKLRTQLMP